MANQLHVDNHYIPQFYLKNWAVNKKVIVYNTLVSHRQVPMFQSKSPESICYIKHLYTDRYDKIDYDVFERWISEKIEVPYKLTQDKILNNQKLEYDDYQNLGRFAVAQYLRVPKFYVINFRDVAKKLNSSFPDMLQTVGDKAMKKLQYGQLNTEDPIAMLIETIPVSVKRTVKQNDNYFEVEALLGRKAWLSTIQRLSEITINKFPKYKWQIIESLEGRHWYTSDNPVTLLNYYSNSNYDFRGGWGNKGTDIFMPISPKYLLFTQVGSRRPLVNTVEIQSFFNKCIVENSFMQVYSISEDRFIHKVRPREVNEYEYKRICAMFSGWHSKQSQDEDEFYENEKCNEG